jgi:hypothetical protein
MIRNGKRVELSVMAEVQNISIHHLKKETNDELESLDEVVVTLSASCRRQESEVNGIEGYNREIIC